MNTNLIEIKSGKMKIKLNKKLYPKEIVEKAIEDYKDVCKSSLNGDIVTLDDTEVGYEFCNYVLGLMKINGVV